MRETRKDILATFANLTWRLVSGPLVLLLIPIYLDRTQQGYWYLFGSIAALNTFADLGFSNIILQFSAHETAFLHLSERMELEGDVLHIGRLGSFFRFCIKWLSLMCSVVFPVTFAVGVLFFIRDGVLREYIMPWIVYSVGAMINFFNGSLLSFLEGMNQVARIQKSRLVVACVNTVVVAFGLILHSGVYALATASLVSGAVMFFTVFCTFGRTLRQINRAAKECSYPWRKDVLPLLGRYVLSFASGFFIFQIYTPLMHLFHGPVYSGKVGLSMTLVTATFSFSNIFVYTVVPRMNMLIEVKDWQSLDRLFKKRLILSLLAYVFIVVCFIVILRLFGNFALVQRMYSRFLPATALWMLIAGYFFQVPINAFALYLRGHKQEPYWHTSIAAALWIAPMTWLAGKFLPPELFFVGFLSQYLWGLPVATAIFLRLRKKWHK